MRNLKRVLSLALATVMLLGMMVIGAGAADAKKEAIKASDLTDMATVVNKDAVALMVDLGIVEGKPDKTYDPKGIVDRATMAKLVYKVLMGTADESSFKGTSTPLTDIKGNWAEGFINYCYSMKIVAGVGDNKFNPSGKVTVASAAKMLLVALGYDAKAQGYEGDAMWSVNIMRDAQLNGLLNDVTQKSTDELTRDNAAQMIYNALAAYTRTAKYDRDMGEKYVSGYDISPVTLGLSTYGLVKYIVNVADPNAPAVVFSSTYPAHQDADDTTKAAAVKTAVDGAKVELAVTSTDAGFKFAPEMVASNVAVYAKVTYKLSSDGKAIVKLNFEKLYSTSIVKAATAVLGTSMNGTKIDGYDGTLVKADLTTKNSKNKGFIAPLEAEPAGNNLNGVMTYFLNGASSNGSGAAYGNGIADKRVAGTGAGGAVKVATADVSGIIDNAGVIVEMLDSNSNGKIDVVKITEKKVATLSADASTKVDGSDTLVKVPGVPALGGFVNVKTVSGYTDLKKGDVVLYVKVGDVTYLEKAEYVEGVVSALKSGDVKIGDKFYAPSGLISNALVGWNDYKNTYKMFLDNNGTVVKAVKVTAETTDEYAVIVGSGWAGNATEIGGTNYAQAKIMKMDGTTEIVKTSKVDSVAPTSLNFGSVLAVNKFYTYTIDDKGGYEFTTVAGASATGTAIVNNQAKFDGTNVANSETIFLVKVTDASDATKITYKAYTGIAALPKMTATAGQFMTNKGGVANYVYLTVGSNAIDGLDSEATYVFFPNVTAFTRYPKTSTNPSQYDELTAYVDGVKTTVKVNNAANLTHTNTNMATNSALHMFKTQNENGAYVTGTTEVASADFKAGIVTASGGVLQVGGDANAYATDSDTKVYSIKGKEVTAISAADLTKDMTDFIKVVSTGSKNYVTTIFVIDVDSAIATLTTSVDYIVAGTNTPETVTWAGGNGTTVALAKAATITKTGVAKDATLKIAPNATANEEITVTLIDGTAPTVTGATTAQITGTLTYAVTSEDGATVTYYKLSYDLTSAA